MVINYIDEAEYYRLFNWYLNVNIFYKKKKYMRKYINRLKSRSLMTW
ncbi:MAG: hypothetical protein JWP94_1952 [Mucilaginibacter sp.]|jgi:hypothetical protein|nr:hypothetical protein [Mucilaginibacter sp.]